MRTDQTSTGTRVDHFGRSTPPTPTCGSSWADRGENSEPGETHPRKRRLTPAIRELQRGRIRLVMHKLGSRTVATVAAACLCSGFARAAENQRGPALANPVAGLQLEELSATRERPLFSPSRRLPPPPAPPPQVAAV